MDNSNIGETGVESIRISGRKIEDLQIPLEAIKATEQLPEALETERKSKVANIRRRYPASSIEFLDSKLDVCEHNIVRMQDLIKKEQTTINEYSGLLTLCRQRDDELDVATGELLIAAIKERYPPYNTDAMEKQIIQCGENIERAEDVIKKEYASIQEVAAAIARCEDRDMQLKELGEKV